MNQKPCICQTNGDILSLSIAFILLFFKSIFLWILHTHKKKKKIAEILQMWQMLNHFLFAVSGRQTVGKRRRGKERHRFVPPPRAVFTQARLNNVLTAQVQDKLTAESRREGWKTDVDNLL